VPPCFQTRAARLPKFQFAVLRMGGGSPYPILSLRMGGGGGAPGYCYIRCLFLIPIVSFHL
jgi:hypothetical protein